MVNFDTVDSVGKVPPRYCALKFEISADGLLWRTVHEGGAAAYEEAAGTLPFAASTARFL